MTVRPTDVLMYSLNLVTDIKDFEIIANIKMFNKDVIRLDFRISFRVNMKLELILFIV